MELASLSGFTASHLAFLEQLTGSIIGVVLNTIEATMRTEGLLTAIPAARRGTAGAADRTAADQRGARQQGQAARRAERRSRTQEPGNRTGAARAGGQGRGAGADLALQIRVPGEHVARAAHAAEQHSDSRPAAVRERRRQPDRSTGGIRQDHPWRGHRPAEPDQRHPGPVEDRVRNRHRGVRGPAVHAPARDPRAQFPPRGRDPQAVIHTRLRSASGPDDHRPTRSDCCRC